MRSSDNKAFKEWAIVCRALASGAQILILRKGGVAEGPRGFEVTDRHFFLYPTYLHQSPTSVVPGWREELERLVEPSPGRVEIGHYAIVQSWLRIRSLEKLKALRSHHILADAVVEERFNRWQDEGVFALMVRVYALREPAVLPELEAYAGCKSWISLAEQVPLDGVVPVLSDADFDRKQGQIKAIVQ